MLIRVGAHQVLYEMAVVHIDPSIGSHNARYVCRQ